VAVAIHVAVTEHPTAGWTAQQLRNAFPDNDAPGYLLHDRDSVFAHVATTLEGMNIEEVRTARRSRWQNAYVERVIGSIRRECLDHVIAVNVAAACITTTTASRRNRNQRGDPTLPRDAPIHVEVRSSDALESPGSHFSGELSLARRGRRASQVSKVIDLRRIDFSIAKLVRRQIAERGTGRWCVEPLMMSWLLGLDSNPPPLKLRRGRLSNPPVNSMA